MPVFISYSHVDAAFVNKLAAHLVKRNAHVWVDSWELNVGDSILRRVQVAIKESSALLVVLSKASVASEWCKKELSAGLMRELDEKRVVVLPVLVENCDIPVFLREKMYGGWPHLPASAKMWVPHPSLFFEGWVTTRRVPGLGARLLPRGGGF